MAEINNARVWFVVVVIYLVGLAGFLVPALRELFIWLIPFNILFAFGVLLWGGQKAGAAKKLLLFSVCFLFGYFYELAGTKTGIIFGQYAYGNGLGPKVWDVPVLIGLNWFFMVYTSLALSAAVSKNTYIRLFLAPALMVAYDFFLEPFAMAHDMWHWAGNAVPLQNYLAWYAGGLFLCAVALGGRFGTGNRFAPGLFVVQFCFFVILYLAGRWG